MENTSKGNQHSRKPTRELKNMKRQKKTGNQTNIRQQPVMCQHTMMALKEKSKQI